MTDGQANTYEELCRRVAELVNNTRGPLKSVRLTAGDVSIEIEWPEPVQVPAAVPNGAVLNGASAVPHPVPAPPLLPEPPAEAAAAETFTLTAPLVGTFYRAPTPEARAFVEVGDMVEAGRQVAIVEAMKLMNAVTADRPGRIVEVLASDATSVEYGEPLFVLSPA